MPYCTQCGREVASSAAFCGNCGARQSADQAVPPPPYSSHTYAAHDPLAGLSPRTAAILCYVPAVGWVASVVVLASRKFKTDETVRFHAFQGLYLFACWLLVKWVIGPLSDIGPDRFIRVDHLIEGVLLAVSIFMMVKASHQETYVLPIIGELARRSASEQT